MVDKKKYVITSAQANARVNKQFLNTLESYASQHNAELIILPMIGNSAREDWDLENLDKRVQKHDVEYGTKKLNNNIEIDQFNVRPYQVDPITGLQRFVQRGTSKIFASPKQRLKFISHSNVVMPKALITTGAVTLPNYATSNDVSAERRRLGSIARRDHTYGAIMVEIDNGTYFHFRNLHAQRNGKFNDLDMQYNGNDVKHSRPKVMVIGDWHNGYTNKQARKGSLDMITELEPQEIVLHDFFDGHSVSHHMDKQLIYQMIREGADKGNLSLEKELKDGYKELMVLSDKMHGRPIKLVACNHHEFLNRYLDEGRFIKDPHNARLGFELAQAYANHLNPVEIGIKMFGKLPDNIEFLTRESDYKVLGYQLGAHGDRGAFGGRGSIKSKENDFGKGIFGHSHSSEIIRNTHIVGTMLDLNPFYMRGSPTSFTHTNALLSDLGTVQHVNIIKGKYKT